MPQRILKHPVFDVLGLTLTIKSPYETQNASLNYIKFGADIPLSAMDLSPADRNVCPTTGCWLGQDQHSSYFLMSGASR